jgi:hypothetical protein
MAEPGVRSECDTHDYASSRDHAEGETWMSGRTGGRQCSRPGQACPPEPVSLAERRVCGKQVLGGLIHEHYVSA